MRGKKNESFQVTEWCEESKDNTYDLLGTWHFSLRCRTLKAALTTDQARSHCFKWSCLKCHRRRPTCVPGTKRLGFHQRARCLVCAGFTESPWLAHSRMAKVRQERLGFLQLPRQRLPLSGNGCDEFCTTRMHRHPPIVRWLNAQFRLDCVVKPPAPYGVCVLPYWRCHSLAK